MSRRWRGLLVVFLCLILGGSFAVLKPGQPSMPPPSTDSKHDVIPLLKNVSKTQSVPTQYHPLIINSALKAQFEAMLHQLSLSQSDETNADALFKLASHLHLSPQDSAKLSNLFSRFVQYSKKLSYFKLDHLEALNFIQQQQDVLANLINLQLEYFSEEEQQGLFADDLAFMEEAMARQAIYHDPSLTDKQKLALIEQHVKELPASAQQSIIPSLEVQALAEAISTKQPLSLPVSIEVEERLLAYKAKEQDFKNQVRALITQKNRLEEQGVTPEVIQSQLESMLNNTFNANERKRVNTFLKHPELLDIDSRAMEQ